MLDPRTVLASLCLFAFGITIGINSGDAAESLTGTANPDPSHITGAPGDDTIKLQPRDDIDDFRNLQWAFDNTAPPISAAAPMIARVSCMRTSPFGDCDCKQHHLV